MADIFNISYWLCIAVGVLCVVLHLVVRNIVRVRRKMNTVKGIPAEKRHWFYGHVRYFTANERGMMRELKSMMRFPNCMQRWFGPLTCLVLGYQPGFVKNVLNSSACKSNFGREFIVPWIGNGLLTSNGKKWKRTRRLLTPIFHFHSLKRYLPCVNDAAMTLMLKWQSDSTGSVELFRDVSIMSLDNLLRCMLSKSSGCEDGENLNYLKAVKCITRMITERRHNPLHYMDAVYFRTSVGRRYTEALKVAHDFTENAIRERSQQLQAGSNKASELDFLDVLLQAKDENGNGLSHHEIRDELDTFVFEGHDTTTSGISWALYNMAVYPHMQEICRKEVETVLSGGRRIEWEHLPKLEYLTKFIKESMRVYPPVRMLSRQAIDSMTIHDVPARLGHHTQDANHGEANVNVSKTFEKGSLLGVGIFLLHRNPTIWENPDVFDPERFSKESISRRQPHAYIPFGAGPRNCIGQNFAMNEMKVVLAIALSMFKFTVDLSFPRPEMQPAIILRSKTGIHLHIQKLQT